MTLLHASDALATADKFNVDSVLPGIALAISDAACRGEYWVYVPAPLHENILCALEGAGYTPISYDGDKKTAQWKISWEPKKQTV